MSGRRIQLRRRSAGLAAVELALLLPVLLLALTGLIDLARGLQADLGLINLSRESANITARNNSTSMQTAISAVSASAPPLDMNQRGMIYITEVMGVVVGTGPTTRSVVIAQYRWDDAANNVGYRVSHYAPPSKVWTCTNWSSVDGSCLTIPVVAAAPSSAIMDGQLAAGQVVFVSESFYQFNMLFGTFHLGAAHLPTLGPNLYSMTVF